MPRNMPQSSSQESEIIRENPKEGEEEPQYDYDLFVIGGGSGGVRGSRTASQAGAKVRPSSCDFGGRETNGYALSSSAHLCGSCSVFSFSRLFLKAWLLCCCYLLLHFSFFL
jgi:hypothetical protein